MIRQGTSRKLKVRNFRLRPCNLVVITFRQSEELSLDLKSTNTPGANVRWQKHVQHQKSTFALSVGQVSIDIIVLRARWAEDRHSRSPAWGLGENPELHVSAVSVGHFVFPRPLCGHHTESYVERDSAWPFRSSWDPVRPGTHRVPTERSAFCFDSFPWKLWFRASCLEAAPGSIGTGRRDTTLDAFVVAARLRTRTALLIPASSLAPAARQQSPGYAVWKEKLSASRLFLSKAGFTPGTLFSNLAGARVFFQS